MPGSSDSHHRMAVHEVVLLLETDVYAGLTEEQVRERLAQFGPNLLPTPSGGGLARRMLSQFHNPLV